MATTAEILFGTLEDLTDGDFEKFKWFLSGNLRDFPAIPKSRLENATRLDTVDLLVQTYNKDPIQVTRMVLDKINRRDLLEPISEPEASRKPDRPETEEDLDQSSASGEALQPGPKASNKALPETEEDLDQSSASGEALQPGPKASNKALMDPGGQQRLKRDDLKKYSCELTLDTNTVNRKLQLSDNNRKVTGVEEKQPYPDHPDRFDCCQVLCSNGLTGRHYWEVEWSGLVGISVSSRGISRKGDGNDCRFGENDQSGCLLCSDGDGEDDDHVPRGHYVCHNKTGTPISSSSVSNRVAVYVDCPAGSLSFYRVSSDSLIHLHTFNTTFTEPLYPGFGVYLPGSSVSLDQSSASGEALQPGPEASNKALTDHGGEQRLKRDDLKKYSCELTVDTNSIHRKLKLSDKNRKVTCVEKRQPYPDHRDRFDNWFQLLCSNRLTGRRYWEVKWSGWVQIAVSYRGIRRKGGGKDRVFGRNDHSWRLGCSDGGGDRPLRGYSVWHNDIHTYISSSSVSDRVAVYVDCPAGSLSFYSVSSDSPIHLHTFNTTFTKPLYPGCGFGYGSSVSLCDV